MNERKTATIGLIDTRSEAPGILGALIVPYPTMEAAFAANAAFQSQNPTPYVRTKVVTFTIPLDAGTQVETRHLLAEASDRSNGDQTRRKSCSGDTGRLRAALTVSDTS